MSAIDLKTSLLVERQVPEFIRDEYPKFITFLKAYYEFLENDANTAVTSNNLVTTAKSLRAIRDVDESLEQFEKNFYNTYATLIPLEVQANKALLFKHIANLYRSKGSEGSFKLLFQLVFGEDIEVIFPKNNVLRASASNWQLDNKLRINSDVFGYYVGDGSTKTFYLPQQLGPEDITVFIDDVPKQNETDFYVIKEYRRLVFHTAPANNVTIRILYPSFDVNLLNNRKAFGLTSGASAIIENANRKIISDVKTLNLPIELIVISKTLEGNFLNGEIVSIPIIDETNDVTIDIRASTFSVVRKINVTNAGNNYSLGSIVTITGGNAAVNAVGTVSGISSGELDQALVHHGGSVFSLSSPISISGNDSFVTMTAVVDGIDLSGANAANTFTVSPDVVANLSLNIGGTVFLNSANFGAVFSKSNVSGSNTIAEALNFITIQAGPITNVSVISSTIPLSQKDLIVLDAAGAEYGVSLPKRFSKEFKSIGRFKINNGGSNYRIGDEIVFGSNPLGTYGQHAAAVVGNVAASTGAITRIDCANTRIRGTGSVAAGGFTITGTNTFFTQDLKAGDVVDVNGESRIVSTTPVSDTSASVTAAFTFNATNRRIGVYNRWPLGGYGYTQNNFPTITVDSATGAGADVEIDSLVGDGERLSAGGGAANGQVTTIEIINPGSGYQYIPTVNIGGGDGTARATVEIEQSYIQEQGRWTTSDSILSSFERKLQGEDFYVDYSYVISSQIEFTKYKTLLKNLLHPVGLVKYAFYNIQQKIELTDVAVQQSKTLTISGTVNVGNGSAIVVGTNTKFNIANSRRIISIGSSIAVNGEMRRIDNVVSNTRIITTSNVSGLNIVNPGVGYSNGYLVFANGGGQITSLTITNPGSGYENGSFVYSGTDEAINAFATFEVHASNGALRSVTLLSGGLYASAPIVLPNTNPHLVLYANGISITNRGQGYSNGWLQITGGTPLRDANVRLIVHPNTTINTVEVLDSGLYQTQPTLALPNTSPNVVISNVTVTSRGNGHSNGVLTFSGGNPARAATVRVETFPSNTAQVVSITANNNSYGVNGYIQFSDGGYDNIGANARIYVNSVGGIVNVVVQNRGLYKGTPIATANVGNAVFTLRMLPMDGQIRNITIVDPGLYSSAPTATLNTTPTSISSITSNTAANVFVGRNLANGYLIFSGGLAVRDANATYQVYPSNGVINMRSIIITDVGLYRVPPTVVTPNVTPVSVTQVLISSGGAGYVAGNVVFSTSQGTANLVANATVSVDGLGSINKITMNDVGLYANGRDITIVGILNPATATLQTPTTPAVLSVGYNANTLNIANLVVSTAANAGQTAVVGVVASNNSYTSAAFSLTAVPNTQTNAVITVGFTQQNTAANVLVEIFPNARSVTSVTTNAGAIAVNSWINFSAPFVTDANIANARIFVNTTGHIVNVTVYANGLYSGLPIIANAYTSLTYYQNNEPIITNNGAYTNAVFTIGTADYSPNGAIRRLTVNTSATLRGTGKYYYTPDFVPNTTGAGAGSGAVITLDPISWYQTANAQTAIILSPITPVISESGNDIVTERGDSVILE